jgi:hypothetical protein
VHLGGELPAEVEGVLETEVDALAADGEVGVGGIARDQQPALAVAVRLAGGVGEDGEPARRVRERTT